MAPTRSSLSRTQEDIRRLETFMTEAETISEKMSAVNHAVHRFEILLHTGIDLALAAAVVMRRGKVVGPGKKMHIKLVVET